MANDLCKPADKVESGGQRDGARGTCIVTEGARCGVVGEYEGGEEEA